MNSFRVGIGYDIHRATPGRRLVLGGIEIPADFGLSGHSDADVILHAVMDALLGAASLGDIGTHFPPGSNRFRDVDSLELLRDVRAMVMNAGFRPVNVDVIVVAEEPKIEPYANAMRQRIAAALDLASNAIGIKATTNEGMGPEGRREAISAQAVALLEWIA